MVVSKRPVVGSVSVANDAEDEGDERIEIEGEEGSESKMTPGFKLTSRRISLIRSELEAIEIEQKFKS